MSRAESTRRARRQRLHAQDLRSKARDSGGFTLVELLVTMLITLIVLALIPPILQTVLYSNTASQGISGGTAQARLAVQSMASQVKSADQICLATTLPDGTAVSPGSSVLVHSLAYGKRTWVQWTVARPSPTSPYVLEEQRWADTSSTSAITTSMSLMAASIPHLPASSQPSTTTLAATSVLPTSAVLNGSVNPNGADTTYYFEYGTTISYGSTTPVTGPLSGTSPIVVSRFIGALTPGTTYHFDLVATNAYGTTNGGDRTFTTSTAPPIVTIGAATGVSSTGATLNGTVNPNGFASTYYFDYGTTTAYSLGPTASASAGSGTSALPESAFIAGLTPNTTYHFRIVATNIFGTTTGSDQTFTTSPPPPDAITGAATSISSTGATLNGTVNPNGSATTYYFDYGTTTAYSMGPTAVTSAGSGTSVIPESAVVTGLTPGTIYHFQLVATNGVGTTTGGDLTFTTLAAAPTVTTGAAKCVSTTSATLNGSVTPSGGLATTYQFEYGTTAAYGATTPSASAGSGLTAVAESATITGLTPNITYDFRIDATNAQGTTPGLNQTFATSVANSSPTVVATPIANSSIPSNPAPFSWPGGSTTVQPPTSIGSPQSLLIDLVISQGKGQNKQTSEIKSTIAALNTPYTP